MKGMKVMKLEMKDVNMIIKYKQGWKRERV